MSGSTPLLDLIQSSQASKEVTANDMFNAASPASIFSRRGTTSAALTWGYYGGAFNASGTVTQIANGTLALTANSTCYIEVTPAGAVQFNTTAFNAANIPLYTVVTGASTVTSWIDYRVMALSSIISNASITNAKLAFDGGALAIRNKIIGGDFTTNPWQRGTSFAAVVNNAYTADRWIYGKGGAAIHTISKSADAPTASQAGIYTGFSLGLAVTTAQTVFAAADFNLIQYKTEGLNAASFGFGQAGNRSVTLSFWVKGAKTGIHCVSFINSALDRSYIAEYTITTANTWEYKSITISVDTTGTWLYDNGIGLSVRFALAAGTTFQPTANAWQAGNFTTTANQVNELDTVGNNFKIALVQLEAGSTATPFETRSVGQELTLCQRYAYQSTPLLKGTSTSTTTAVKNSTPHPVKMRAIPSVTLIGTVTVFDGGTATSINAITASSATVDFIDIDFNTVAANLTANRTCSVIAGGAGSLLVSAEL